MRNVRYAVAVSLDGYIAGPKGEFDWIEIDPAVDVAAFFREFYAQFDIALMGRKTYELVKGPVDSRIRTYVISKTLAQSECQGVTVLSDNWIEELYSLRSQNGKDIWLYGGGSLFGSLAAAHLVDRVELEVMPILLGNGIPLISGIKERVKLKLLDCRNSEFGTVSLKYQVDYGEK